MADMEEEALETLLNKATNPANREPDADFMHQFCEQINKELEGPQISCRLISHKIQSPQEREALHALVVVDNCVRNCGRRFHQEVGKFRFLNELIKVISPKYLGGKTTEKVKKKCIELIFTWSTGLKHESKIAEAYDMLKKQGIVKQDPIVTDNYMEPLPPPREDTLFKDEDKSKLLARLLKSKHPEDLQAANRLIKNMVKQDAEKQDKVSKRVQELDTVDNNVKLLEEMLNHYNPETCCQSDRDIMKELFDSLEKHRPTLFRMASDTDDKEDDAMSKILKANDEVTRVMGHYRRIVGDDAETNGNAGNASALLDLGHDSLLLGADPSPQPSAAAQAQNSVLDDQLAALGLSDQAASSQVAAPVSQPRIQPPPGVVPGSQPAKPASDIDELGAIFAQASTANNIGFGAFGGLTTVPAPSNPPFAMGQHVLQPMGQSQPVLQPMSVVQNLAPAQQQPVVTPAPQKKALQDLDMLGQKLLQQNLPADRKPVSFTPPPKVPMNQLQRPTLNSQNQARIPQVNPVVPTQAAVDPVQSLANLFVPLEAIQPGTVQPINAYDKNNIKIVIHFSKDSPRPDVTVMVVTVMSMNTSPVKNFTFQAAVPKHMKVKLQPPSATDLPAYNPILPPAAITQVMLLANPQKEKVRLKFKISYTHNDQPLSDVGDVTDFPLS